jgi:cyclic dehypoxanthinyl futalosine synthase
MTTLTTSKKTLTATDAGASVNALRVGRIGFLNMLPMHWALPVEPAIVGVPTTINRALLDGEIDVACISSIEYARNADDLTLLPSLCVAASGAVDSIFVLANEPLEQLTQIAVTPASATSVALLEVMLAELGADAQLVPLEGAPHQALQQQGHGVLLIGDEAMQARADSTLSRYAFLDLAELWSQRMELPMVFAVWAIRRDALNREGAAQAAAALDASLRASLDAFSTSETAVANAARDWNIPELAASEYFEKLCYAFGAVERDGLRHFYRLAAQYGQIEEAPELTFVEVATPRDDALAAYARSVGSKAAIRETDETIQAAEFALGLEEAALDVDVDGVLHKALRDERISDVETVALLQSRRLLDVGQVAHELRMRRVPSDQITFVVDRNINYTNICVTDCGFCAFYRRPGDGSSDSYLHSTDKILTKIQETIDLGGTAALLQGGHNPDLGIEWYLDLFRAVKDRFPAFHLHALSPPEIQHIARRSKLSTSEVLTQLRDAGLDSLPGGGGEILVDRVRRIIAPKKTSGTDWIAIMREAHRLGMSTTASMMYGHVELLAERVMHMGMVRDLQDEMHGFRAFISWTFQPGDTALAQLMASGHTPYSDRLPTTPTPFDYLLTQAVSRIYLDNVDHIQSSWVTQGMKVGQAALQFGADDLGSIMIEENVVSAAGTTYQATVEDFVHAISALGARPIQRDTLYRTVREHTL